jgi:hypothetical protein
MGASQIAAACAWANAGGGPPCTLPTAPVDLGVSAGNSQNTLNWPAGIGATGYNIKRALVSGGPYTVIGTSAAPPYVDLTAVNWTTYYYVVSATNACGESAGNSIESHGKPFIPFSYAPATSIINWTDTNGGGQNGNLAFFNATADMASVTNIFLTSQALTAISNLGSLPALQVLIAESNFLTSVDLSHNPALTWVDFWSNQLTTLDISANPLVTTLYVFGGNSLTVLAVNTILSQLVTFGLGGGTVNISGQVPAAPPSVGPPNGIAAAAALVAAGWTVTTD